MASKVVYLEDRPPLARDSERTARLWENMDACTVHWETLAQGSTHEGRFDPRGDVAAVYAYCADVLRSLKRTAVEAIYLEQLSDAEVIKRIVAGLGELQAECEKTVLDGSQRSEMASAISDCAVTLINMRLSAACDDARP